MAVLIRHTSITSERCVYFVEGPRLDQVQQAGRKHHNQSQPQYPANRNIGSIFTCFVLPSHVYISTGRASSLKPLQVQASWLNLGRPVLQPGIEFLKASLMILEESTSNH